MMGYAYSRIFYELITVWNRMIWILYVMNTVWYNMILYVKWDSINTLYYFHTYLCTYLRILAFARSCYPCSTPSKLWREHLHFKNEPLLFLSQKLLCLYSNHHKWFLPNFLQNRNLLFIPPGCSRRMLSLKTWRQN